MITPCLVFSLFFQQTESLYIYLGTDTASQIARLALEESEVNYVINYAGAMEGPHAAFSKYEKPHPIVYWKRLCDCDACFYLQRSKLIEHLRYKVAVRRAILRDDKLVYSGRDWWFSNRLGLGIRWAVPIIDHPVIPVYPRFDFCVTNWANDYWTFETPGYSDPEYNEVIRSQMEELSYQ